MRHGTFMATIIFYNRQSGNKETSHPSHCQNVSKRHPKLTKKRIKAHCHAKNVVKYLLFLINLINFAFNHKKNIFFNFK